MENIILCAVFKHADEETGIAHVNLKYIIYGIAIQRKLRKSQIITTRDYTGMRNPDLRKS